MTGILPFIRFTLLAIVFVVLGAVFRPPTFWVTTGLPNDRFWMSKAFHAQRYDIVLAGDSRIFRGISPSQMKTLLPQRSIFNFGFDHNGYNLSYLDAIDNLIDSSSNYQAVVLGISPQSLTLEAAGNNGFLSLRSTGRFERHVRLHLSRYLDLVRPFNSYAMVNLIRGRGVVNYIQHLHGDGWAASRKIPETPNYQISRYQGRFDNNMVSVQLQQQLFDRIQNWTSDGTCVFGLRMPTSAAMVDLENNQSGFNQTGFVRKFEQVGGIWLEFNQTGYHSYDGSHLRDDAARAFSLDLAAAMQQHASRQCKPGL